MKDWNFPGARWWKFDFHTHTPASIDFSDKDLSPESWIRGFMESGIDCVAITDHNSGDWIDKLKQELAQIEKTKPQWYRPLFLFPGVEISESGSVHILAIFDPSKSTSDVDSLLGAINYLGRKGASDSETVKSLSEVIQQIVAHGGIVIPAHVDKTKGLFQSLQGTSLKQVLDITSIYAMELCSDDYCKPEIYKSEKTNWVEIRGSDFHGHVNRPRGDFTWIKLATPCIEGLRLALIDGRTSVGRDMDSDPNQYAEFVIEKFEVSGAKYIGRPDAITCRFSPFLNTVIGGRGSGKSTLLEFMRLTLRREQQLPDRLANEYRSYFSTDDEDGLLTRECLLQLYYRKGDARYRLNWDEGFDTPALEEQTVETGDWCPAEGDINSLFPVSIYSQKQIFELASNPQGLLGIIDRVPEIGFDELFTVFNNCNHIYKLLWHRQIDLQHKISEESKLKGQLNDLKRQLAQVRRKISKMKKSGHDDLLQNFQLRQQQLREIKYFESQWQELLDGIRLILDESDIPLVNERLFTQHAEILDALKDKQDVWENQINEVHKSIEKLQADLQSWQDGKGKQGWMKALKHDLQQYKQLRAQLEEENIDPAIYPSLLQQHSQVEEKLQQIEEYKLEINKIKKLRNDKFKEVQQYRNELSYRRKEFIQRISEGNQPFNISIDQYGEPWKDAEKKIRQVLQTESRFRSDFDELKRIYLEHQDGWEEVKNTIIAIRGGKHEPQDLRFRNHLRNLPGESMIDLLM